MSCMEWLYKNNYFLKTKDASKKESHLLYDGGAVYVPEDKYFLFLKHYANDFKNNVQLHFIEQRTPIYKYMIDLDIYDDHYLSKEEIIEVCTFINKIVNEFYEKPYSCIVCNCTGKPKTNKEGLIHTGIHIIWPKLFVKDNISKLFRYAILQKIKEVHLKEHWDWDTVFDKLIYEKYGFTMVGSCKKKSDRVYVPYLVLSSDGSILEDYINRLKENYLDTMLETSLSYVPDSVKTELFDGHVPYKLPEWFTEKYQESFEKENEAVLPLNRRIKNSSTNNPSMNTNYTNAEDYIYNIIFKMILTYMPAYKNENELIRGIFRYPDGNILITTTSRYCQNIEREHSSCGIYFYANKNGLCQKCLCPCNKLNGRKHGLCSKYTSPYYKFEKDIEVLIFGNNRIEFKEVEENTLKTCTDKCTIENKSETETKSETESITETKTETKSESKTETKSETETKKPKTKPKPGGYFVQGMTSEKARIDRLKEQCGKLLLKSIELNK